MFDNWDIETSWHFIAMLLLLIVVTIGILFIVAPKNVDYYYLNSSNTNSSGAGFCAYAHWTWHIDQVAFCSDEKDKVLDFVAKANATLPKH